MESHNMYFQPKLWARLQRHSKKHRISASWILRKALSEYLGWVERQPRTYIMDGEHSRSAADLAAADDIITELQ
jgi:predicted transcriptional regulator